MKKDYFAEKAGEYDKEDAKTQNVDNIAKAILSEIAFAKGMHIMDFGSGTGLLLAKVAPHVGTITAVDISSAMTAILKSKIQEIDCRVNIVEMDLTKETLDNTFDAIISSMTIHHIEDVAGLFAKFYALLNEGGAIAIADLDKEDGSFHTSDTGVFHLGFDRDEFMNMASQAGFKDVTIQTVNVMDRDTGSYPVFLLTGRK